MLDASITLRLRPLRISFVAMASNRMMDERRFIPTFSTAFAVDTQRKGAVPYRKVPTAKVVGSVVHISGRFATDTQVEM